MHPGLAQRTGVRCYCIHGESRSISKISEDFAIKFKNLQTYIFSGAGRVNCYLAEYDLISFKSINLFWKPLASQYIVSFIFIRSERVKTRSITCKFWMYAHCIHAYALCIIFFRLQKSVCPKTTKALNNSLCNLRLSYRL